MTFCWICDKDRETDPRYCPECKLQIKEDKKVSKRIIKKPFKIISKRIVYTQPHSIKRGIDNEIIAGVSYMHKHSNLNRFVKEVGRDGDIYWEDRFGRGTCSYKTFAIVCDIKHPLD